MTFSAAFFASAGLPLSNATAVQVDLDIGETIELDTGVVNDCRSEGLTPGSCACAVSIMLEQESLESMSLTGLTRLVDSYPRECASARSCCMTVACEGGEPCQRSVAPGTCPICAISAPGDFEPALFAPETGALAN